MAFTARHGNEAFQHCLTHALATPVGEHRHPADVPVGKQAAGPYGSPRQVASDHVQAVGIDPVPLQFLGDLLFDDKNLTSDGSQLEATFFPRDFGDSEFGGLGHGALLSQQNSKEQAVAPNSRLPRQAVLVLILLTIIWGYSWPIVKIALYDAPVLPFAALRTAIGALGLLLYLRFLSGAPFRPGPLTPILVLASLQTTGFSLLSALPVLAGGAGKTSVLVFTMPFWLLLFAHPVLGERIRGAQWLSVALSFAGLALIIEPWKLKGTLAGNLSAVAAGVCWAASAVYVKWYRARKPVDLANLTTWQMVAGMFPLALLAWIVPTGPVHWTMSFTASVLFLGLLSNALGWVLWMYVLQHLPAGVAGLSILAIPAIAVISAWIHLGERPLPLELVGMTLVGSALAILGALGLRQQRAIEPETGQE